MDNDTSPIDRHDLEAMKDWIKAEFKAVDKSMGNIAEALKVAAHEREKKDAELNDVRHRFVPRETFDSYVEEQVRIRRTYFIALLGVAATLILRIAEVF